MECHNRNNCEPICEAGLAIKTLKQVPVGRYNIQKIGLVCC